MIDNLNKRITDLKVNGQSPLPSPSARSSPLTDKNGHVTDLNTRVPATHV